MARILVVEDNRTNLDLMVYLLRAFGHVPVGISDPFDAMERAKTDSFDLALFDILMPGMDGFELVRRFKADPGLEHLKVVAVTALAMVGDREKVLSAGFDGYISKPIDPENFVIQVDAQLPQELRSIAPKAGGTAAAQQRTGAAGPTILVVDDVQNNLNVIVSALRPFGYRVVEARSAQAAIELAEQSMPALILCDVHMPGSDGFVLLEYVKSHERFSSTPFIFMSSTVWQTSEKRRGLELGAKDFLLRPIDPRSLLDVVERALKDTTLAEDSHHR